MVCKLIIKKFGLPVVIKESMVVETNTLLGMIEMSLVPDVTHVADLDFSECFFKIIEYGMNIERN